MPSAKTLLRPVMFVPQRFDYNWDYKRINFPSAARAKAKKAKATIATKIQLKASTNKLTGPFFGIFKNRSDTWFLHLNKAAGF